MTLDTRQIAHDIVKESETDRTHEWRLKAGVFTKSIRFTVSLVDLDSTIRDLRFIASELPKIADAIELESTVLDRQVMAESLIKILRNKIKRGT